MHIRPNLNKLAVSQSTRFSRRHRSHAEKGKWDMRCSQSGPAPKWSPYDPESSYRAADVISFVEAARAATPPVLFYLYDAPLLPKSVASQVAKLEACGATTKLYHYGGEHPWARWYRRFRGWARV